MEIPIDQFERENLFKDGDEGIPYHIMAHTCMIMLISGGKVFSVDQVRNFGEILGKHEDYMSRHNLNPIEVISPFHHLVLIELRPNDPLAIIPVVWEFEADEVKMIASKVQGPNDKWNIFFHKPTVYKIDYDKLREAFGDYF